MTDLITHLREQAAETLKTMQALGLTSGTTPLGKLLCEAADEIERLRNSNLALRHAVEALSKELTTEAQSMMRQPEAGVIRALAERLHQAVFRRKWRDAP